MGQPTLGTKQEPPYTKADYYDDNSPSIDELGVFLADARELQRNLEHLQKEYPNFYMRFVNITAENLVHDLELLIEGLEE